MKSILSIKLAIILLSAIMCTISCKKDSAESQISTTPSISIHPSPKAVATTTGGSTHYRLLGPSPRYYCFEMPGTCLPDVIVTPHISEISILISAISTGTLPVYFTNNTWVTILPGLKETINSDVVVALQNGTFCMMFTEFPDKYMFYTGPVSGLTIENAALVFPLIK